jgi:hypothetical protein
MPFVRDALIAGSILALAAGCGADRSDPLDLPHTVLAADDYVERAYIEDVLRAPAPRPELEPRDVELSALPAPVHARLDDIRIALAEDNKTLVMVWVVSGHRIGINAIFAELKRIDAENGWAEEAVVDLRGNAFFKFDGDLPLRVAITRPYNMKHYRIDISPM